MKKIAYLLLIPVALMLFLISSCDDKEKSSGQEQLVSRKIKITDLGLNFTQELNEKLYKSVMDGQIKAYRYDSITPGCMFKPEEIKSLSTLEESIQYAPDSSAPDFLVDTVIKQVFTPADVAGYSVSEKWSLDKEDNEIEGVIFAFALNWQPKIAGIQIPETPLFWVDYNDVIKLIKKEQAEELRKNIFNSFIKHLAEN